MEHQSLFNKCQAKHPRSLALSKISLWQWIPLSPRPWIYSSLRVINIGKYTGSGSDIWKKQANKPKKLSRPFVSCQRVSPFLTSHKILVYIYFFSSTLSSTHFIWAFTLYTSMTPMKHPIRILSVISMLQNFVIPSLSPLASLLSSTFKHSNLSKNLFSWIPEHHTLFHFLPTSLILSLNILYFFLFCSQLLN